MLACLTHIVQYVYTCTHTSPLLGMALQTSLLLKNCRDYELEKVITHQQWKGGCFLFLAHLTHTPFNTRSQYIPMNWINTKKAFPAVQHCNRPVRTQKGVFALQFRGQWNIPPVAYWMDGSVFQLSFSSLVFQTLQLIFKKRSRATVYGCKLSTSSQVKV